MGVGLALPLGLAFTYFFAFGFKIENLMETLAVTGEAEEIFKYSQQLNWVFLLCSVGGSLLYWAIFHLIVSKLETRQGLLRSEVDKKNNFFRELVTKLPYGVITTDSQGQFVYWNAYAHELLPTGPVAEPMDLWPTTYKVYSDSYLTRLMDADDLPLAKAVRGEMVESQKLFIKRDDDSVLTLNCSAIPLYSGDMMLEGTIIIFYDASKITKQEEMKQEFFFQSKMETLGSMSSTLAHEINTPLSTISLTLEMISKRLRDGRDVEDLLDRANKATTKMADIVRSFRNYSRKVKIEDDFKVLDFKSLIEDALTLCSLDLNFREIDVRTKTPDGPVLCEGSSSGLTQVLINLLNNSRDAIEHLEDKWIEIELAQTETHVLLRVTDSGLGVKEEDAARMFQPFFSTKAEGKGTGIGLGVSFQIVKMHQGLLNYELYQGHTSFSFRFEKFRTSTQKDAA